MASRLQDTVAPALSWPPDLDGQTEFKFEWISAFLEKTRLDLPGKLLHECIDVLHTKHHADFDRWFRDMRTKLVSSGERTKTTDSGILRKLFGDHSKPTYPEIARSIDSEHCSFQCDIVHLSPLGKDATRTTDDSGLKCHMTNVLQDKGLDKNRPIAVFFRELSQDTRAVHPGMLSQERGGKRVKSVWLLAYMLYDLGLTEPSHPLAKNCSWLFANVHVVNVGQKTETDRATSVLKSCALDTCYTKMTTAEAYYCFVIPRGRAQSHGAEPTPEDLAAIWKEWTINDPKLAGAICNARNMGEFISRVHNDVKWQVWQEQLRMGNLARVSSTIYGHNSGHNLLQGAKKTRWGMRATGKAR